MGEQSFIYFFIDLKNSRVFADQQIANHVLKLLADHLNHELADKLITRFSIREGDAVVGGGSNLTLMLDVYDACLSWYYGVELERFLKQNRKKREEINFYFGAGIGDITTAEELADDIEQVNGSAIRHAKEACDEAKRISKIETGDPSKKSGDYSFALQPFKFYGKTSENNELGQMLNGMMYLAYEALIHNESQNQLIYIKGHYPELSNHEIAQWLGYKFDRENQKERYVMSSRISRLVATSYYKLHQKALNDLKNYLFYLNGGAK